MAKMLNSKFKSKKAKNTEAESIVEGAVEESIENSETLIEDSIISSEPDTLKNLAMITATYKQPRPDKFYNIKLGRQELNNLPEHKVMQLLEAAMSSVDKITITKVDSYGEMQNG